ncbi:hypothetical protein SLEP1_g171 [Rubroshorea leprosula]|uniref:Uncharacterized protein n=1 Tax=Rubroshorea leprosula TaxID=152421 RepID=A0AAV5HIC3_9ROSI|nr:hypothetical protein SLEP1_g171 [Rubroshorea leprosula]
MEEGFHNKTYWHPFRKVAFSRGKKGVERVDLEEKESDTRSYLLW